MRVRERCSDLDQLMIASDAAGCAFITAWNPGSVRVLETANCTRQNQLIQEVQDRGFAFLHGRGVGGVRRRARSGKGFSISPFSNRHVLQPMSAR